MVRNGMPGHTGCSTTHLPLLVPVGEPSMRIKHTVAALAIVTGVALSVGACGNWTPPLPSGPSALPSPLDDVPSEGATIVGTLNGGNASLSPTLADGVSNETVSVDGTSITAAVSVSGTFVLKGVPSGNVTLRFSGSQSGTVRLDRLEVRERIDVKIRISGSRASIDAVMRIKIDNTTEIEGDVSAMTGTCPSLSLLVSGWNVTVNEQSDSHCADIRVGIRVQIHGQMSNRVVIVVKLDVTIQSSPAPTPAPPSDDDDDDDDD